MGEACNETEVTLVTEFGRTARIPMRAGLLASATASTLWCNLFLAASIQVIKRKSYGYALSLDEAKAALRAEYEAWKGIETTGLD
jgi:hypothetical protein